MKDTWNPEQYEKFKNERSQPFFDLLALVEKTNSPVVIDLGCGTGELTKILHETVKAKSTLGVDNSESMLKKAQAFASSTLKFEPADIQKLSAPNTYDVIFSNAAIQWCANHKAIFSNLKKSLKEGGQLAIQMPMNHDYPTHTVAKEVSQREPFKKYMGELAQKTSNMLKTEEYSQLLTSLDFKRQSVNLKTYKHVLESREAVVDWVKGTTLTHYESKLPPDIFKTFMTEYKSALFKVLPDDKPFHFPFKRILIWASLI